ncbi:MAG: type II toxin-antitoxin system RelE/ParE family toxin [Armatimonadetes bacterium]|nr:type II toxin-antitoxin system RelE/ParE family toxin [Armatimonadota bacterium]
MAYQLVLKPRAEKDLADLPREAQRRVDACLLALATDPRPHRAEKLRDAGDLWRVWAGREYRVLYAIDDAGQTVTVARIRHRREAYR